MGLAPVLIAFVAAVSAAWAACTGAVASAASCSARDGGLQTSCRSLRPYRDAFVFLALILLLSRARMD